MQQIKKSQLRHRSKFGQLILLNEQAHIISSCDSIFETHSFQGSPVTDWFPFLDSIYSSIWSTLSTQSNISFNKIETPVPQLPGIYDFTFSQLEIEQHIFLLWSIYDYTDLYEDFKQFQQRRNELEIHRETLERRYKGLSNKEDIKIQQNIIIESLDHLQLTYYNKIKSALLAPVNALDGLTFLLAGALENKNIAYTQQLRVALKQLDLILDELEHINIENSVKVTKQPFSIFDLEIALIDSGILKDSTSTVVFHIEEDIPKLVLGNHLYLKQTLFGILGNALDIHPSSNFKINISRQEQSDSKVSLQFEIIELLDSTNNSFLSDDDYTTMVYRLSIIKQLVDLQKGTIGVTKHPKNLSISISFSLDYQLPG